MKKTSNVRTSKTIASTNWSEKARQSSSKNAAIITSFATTAHRRLGPKTPASCINHLEANYKAFFSWFALRGRYFKVPGHRLVMCPQRKAGRLQQLHKAFELQPLVSDGFMSRRDNLLVMCVRPLDEAYESLSKDSTDLWSNQQFDRAELLKGVIPLPKRRQPEAVRKAMTISLVLRAMEDKAQFETITHIGSRQLAAAIGLLPRTVASPEWIQFVHRQLLRDAVRSVIGTAPAPRTGTTLRSSGSGKNKRNSCHRMRALRKVVTDEMFNARPWPQQRRTPQSPHDGLVADVFLGPKEARWALRNTMPKSPTCLATWKWSRKR